MWLIGGSKTKVAWVEAGRVASRHCDGCGRVASFREGDVTDHVHAFFVDLFETTQRRMVCVSCGDDHDVEEFFADAPRPPAAPKKLPSAGARDQDVDEMLAELKRKMGKR
jgi:crotonobetainyl-CoA:carnitine CoA-transferase CaiB-like acyl-CoA transferase